jgi:1-acyl-sn-glycerol-3-phosphate acyltransferase
MYRGYRVARNLARFLAHRLFNWRIEGTELVPKTGGFIIASNHVSYADPPLIGAAAPRRLRFMAKRQLFRAPLFGQLISFLGAFPIHREGLDRQALRLSAGFLAAGQGVLVFPTGTRARRGKELRARPGVSMLAAAAEVPVVPARIDGSARLWDAFLRRRHLRIRFGAPIPPPPQGSGQEHREGLRAHTSRIMGAIDSLAGD